jgi:hypothetical protein
MIIEVEDLDDVGVTERGHDARLTAKTNDEALIVGEKGVQDLDGDPPVELDLLPLIDLGHAAVTYMFKDLISA